jgi:hypothetical protein
MTVSLAMADPRLAAAWQAIHFAYVTQHPDHEAILTCVYRSPMEQAACYAKGRTVPGTIITNCDGVTIKSKHNALPSRALDFAILIGGKITWDADEYEPVGLLGEAQGLRWGGRWARPHDCPHLELKETP